MLVFNSSFYLQMMDAIYIEEPFCHCLPWKDLGTDIYEAINDLANKIMNSLFQLTATGL